MSVIRRVHANGIEFAYLEQGQGPLVLMLHGFPDTPHTWNRVRPALAAAGFRVVTPWTRGYFPTQIPSDGDYTSDTLGRDAIALVEALGEEKAILVGHDWGASAAYSAVGLAPERFSFLITMAIPHPAGITPTPRLLWTLRHFASLGRKGAAKWVERDDYAHIDELVRRWSPAWKALPAGETTAVKDAFRNPGCLDAALGYYRAAGVRLPPGQRKRITIPAVAIAGLHDMLDVSVFERARTRYTDAYEVVRVPGGHFMHREHPEEFIAALLGVLQRSASPRAQGGGDVM